MRALDRELATQLELLELSDLRRRITPIDSAHGAEVTAEGRRMLMLSSNNYLDLANHPRIRAAAIRAIERYGVGAGASRLIAGSLQPLHDLEDAIRDLKRTEAALVFGSGYLANIGTIAALAAEGDVILSDELNHASLIDGCRLSRAVIRIYRHCDVDHLGQLLRESVGARRRLVVTDSVFSMDGDFAPLRQIVELAREFHAAVMIDEAHAVGVVGPGGAGLAAELNLEKEIDVQVGTLSKALGAYGAYVAGSCTLVEFLVNRARSFIYTTGLPPALAAAASASLELIANEPQRIQRLWDNAAYLRDALVTAGFKLRDTASPILPVIIGESRPALQMSHALRERGVLVTAIRPPTVPPCTARLRVTPTAGLTRADLDLAVAAFIGAGSSVGVLSAGRRP